METSSIVLIVGVALMILERIFKCTMKIKKSKCCGGEIEMSTPPKDQSSLNAEESINEEEKKLEDIVRKLSTVPQ